MKIHSGMWHILGFQKSFISVVTLHHHGTLWLLLICESLDKLGKQIHGMKYWWEFFKNSSPFFFVDVIELPKVGSEGRQESSLWPSLGKAGRLPYLEQFCSHLCKEISNVRVRLNAWKSSWSASRKILWEENNRHQERFQCWNTQFWNL